MELFTQLLFNGLVIGATYALIAIGLTLIFGMMKVVNFAHGEFYMLGAYLAVTAVTTGGFSYFVAIPFAVAVVALCGLAFERLLLRRLRKADLLSTALLTIGFSIFLQDMALKIWGPKPSQVPDPFGGRVLNIGEFSVSQIRLFTLLVAVAAIMTLATVIKYTKLGRAMRATFEHSDAAALQGIEIDRVYSFVFVLGVGLAATAGALLSSVFIVSPEMGNMANLKSFAVVILGGLGSIPGAVVGGFVLGVAESLGAGYISSGYKDGISFLILILALLARPHGIFGRQEAEE